MKERLNIFLELIKFRITVFVMITTVFGYLCATKVFGIELLGAALGIFLLASGSAALNHLQEAVFDAQMERTKNRPIPSGKISRRSVLSIILVLSIVGSILLYISSGLVAVLMGLLALLWYNAIYTPLKRKTSFAIIPGSVIGAIPPVVGWVTGGGHVFDPQALLIAFFFFIWQIPHFWLLLLAFGKDYEDAGYPTLKKYFNETQLARITYVWICVTGVTGLLMPLFSIIDLSFASAGILILVIGLIIRSAKLLRENIDKRSLRKVFLEINLFVAALILFISIEKILLL
ncbi:MAG: protoheme IX farnesyltransferase [Ignavibacteriaceae bacterium]